MNQDLTLDIVKEMIDQIEQKAKELKLNVVIAVVNQYAHPIAVHCMDNAFLASYDIALNKAFTSTALKMPTANLKALCQPGGDLFGMQYTNQGRIVILGGGFPIYKNNQVIGGLGVSGGSEKEDTILANHGLDYFTSNI